MLYRVITPRATGGASTLLPGDVLAAARTAARERTGIGGELYTAECHVAVAEATAEEIGLALQRRQASPDHLFCEGCGCSYTLAPA